MSDKITFSVEKREGLGKGANRQLRVAGKVPGIFYSTTGENIPVKMDEMPLVKLYEKAGLTNVISLDIEGEVKECLIWKLERHPFKNRLQHVDFYGVDADKEIRIKIPVRVTGSSKGVKLGGRLEEYRQVITVAAKAADIPNEVVVDVTDFDIHTSLKVSEIELPENVTAYYDNDFKVLAVVPGRGSAKAEEAED
ncbi:50S ribosomal protein L25 [Halodesulfovibrio sp.]|jgi:large subunit ribosomal protein L25|uniref:50S ribosomal protein L25 n=1 Tax=Halodesulfovibrio sp. TaxID=1912772 RepID=UPI0025FEC311|nr:50S ribosomal protein L25 [Halodesulfovibrio sp.]MCT4534934.1 50S ribosomal protein L25 [Halodesulfovibrio sp.]MCT4627753.1 50S ribosomal protein L25 [Halodesulfovibrio sp.]